MAVRGKTSLTFFPPDKVSCVRTPSRTCEASEILLLCWIVAVVVVAVFVIVVIVVIVLRQDVEIAMKAYVIV